MTGPDSEGLQAASVEDCEHHWVSTHQADFPDGLYWLRQCSQCRRFDLKDHLAEVARKLTEARDRVRAEERQRCIAELTELHQSRRTPNGRSPLQYGSSVGVQFAIERLAAGSAVSVATPEPRCEHGKSAPHPVNPTMEQIFWHEHPLCPGPVATPTEPVRQLRVMEAHRLEDCGDRAACWYVAHRAGLRTVAEQDGQR